jgi:hypothetical protein
VTELAVIEPTAKGLVLTERDVHRSCALERGGG